MNTTASRDRERIRAINDKLRIEFLGGAIVCTEGVAALPDEARREIMTAMRAFLAFDEDNDPYGEHDFGAFEAAGQRLFFKIDYYDRDIQMHSPDPSDAAVTTRVLTIMLADEY